jgi:hypothetical protein
MVSTRGGGVRHFRKHVKKGEAEEIVHEVNGNIYREFKPLKPKPKEVL